MTQGGGGGVEAAETGDRSRFYFLFLEFFFLLPVAIIEMEEAKRGVV